MNRRPPSMRHVNQSVGAFVLVSLIVGVFAIAQASRFNDWFTPYSVLTVQLPPSGSAGLSPGDEVEVLGTNIGRVRSINFDEETGMMSATVVLQTQYTEFIRADSTVTIRKRLAIAGSSYLHIQRGEGERLDWSRARLVAQLDDAPADAIGSIQNVVKRIEERVIPLIENVNEGVLVWTDIGQRVNDESGDLAATLENIRSITTSVRDGQGLGGRLLTDEQLAEEFERAVNTARESINDLRPAIERIDAIASDAQSITRAIREQSERFPALVDRAERTLEQAESALVEGREVLADMPEITGQVADTTERLPDLAVQLQATVAELELLILQLRSLWILGGDGSAETTAPALPSGQVP